jgi:hypothetical protein
VGLDDVKALLPEKAREFENCQRHRSEGARAAKAKVESEAGNTLSLQFIDQAAALG